MPEEILEKSLEQKVPILAKSAKCDQVREEGHECQSHQNEQSFELDDGFDFG